MQGLAELSSQAVFLGVGGASIEAFWRGTFIKYVGSESGKIVNLWIDYPQALAASCLALSVLGTGGAGVAAFATLALLPLVFKATVLWSQPGSHLGRAAGCLDHIVSLVARGVNVAGSVSLVLAAPSLTGKAVFGLGTLLLTVQLIREASSRAMYALSSGKDYYLHSCWTASTYK